MKLDEIRIGRNFKLNTIENSRNYKKNNAWPGKLQTDKIR